MKRGISLVELLVTVSIIAMLAGLAIPATLAIQSAWESPGATRGLLSGALASARAIALSNQRCAGIRFQQADNHQYLTYIIHDPDLRIQLSDDPDDRTWGFRAAEGYKPIKVPRSIGVIDLSTVPADTDFDNPATLNNLTTFSIVFSASGKLIVRDAFIINRNGIREFETERQSPDDIFNTFSEVEIGKAMFLQDDYPLDGYGYEFSRTSLVIYNKHRLDDARKKGTPYTEYLAGLKPLQINRYMGTLITSE